MNAEIENSKVHDTAILRVSLVITKFLLIGLKNQLAKIHNSSFDTSHSARNLGFIFDEHLTFCETMFCQYMTYSNQLYLLLALLDKKN